MQLFKASLYLQQIILVWYIPETKKEHSYNDKQNIDWTKQTAN